MKTSKEKYYKIKRLEMLFIGIALVLLLVGFILTMIGSGSFANYYVEKVDIYNFYSTMIEFLKITIKYSGLFYVGFILIILSTVFFLATLSLFIVDYECYTKKPKELGIILTKINPNKEKVESCEVGAKYYENNSTNH